MGKRFKAKRLINYIVVIYIIKIMRGKNNEKK